MRLTENQIDTMVNRLYERRFNMVDQLEKVKMIRDRRLQQAYEDDLAINKAAINRLIAYKKNMYDLSEVVTLMDRSINRLKDLISC